MIELKTECQSRIVSDKCDSEQDKMPNIDLTLSSGNIRFQVVINVVQRYLTFISTNLMLSSTDLPLSSTDLTLSSTD